MLKVIYVQSRTLNTISGKPIPIRCPVSNFIRRLNTSTIPIVKVTTELIREPDQKRYYKVEIHYNKTKRKLLEKELESFLQDNYIQRYFIVRK